MKRFRFRILALAIVAGAVYVGSALGAATAVPLGTSGSFGVLAGAGISNTGPTTIMGDIGTFPTTSISGTSSMTVGGANNGGNAVTQQAKSDLVTAYDTAAGEGPINSVAADLGGRTLVSGVYNSASSLGLTGTVTLDAKGDPNAVFVFQAGSSFTSASGSNVALINGAQACNVYWQIGSSATLGTGSSFIGNILALTSITVTTGVTIDGRVLARNGAVTLDTDTITQSSCTTGTGTTTSPTTTTPPPSTTTPGTKPPTTTTPNGTSPTTRAPLTPLERKKALARKKAAAKRKLELKKRTSRTTTVVRVVAPPKAPRHRFGFTG
jgi:hypothetical protein